MIRPTIESFRSKTATFLLAKEIPAEGKKGNAREESDTRHNKNKQRNKSKPKREKIASIIHVNYCRCHRQCTSNDTKMRQWSRRRFVSPHAPHYVNAESNKLAVGQ
jgi:hypothetical protein